MAAGSGFQILQENAGTQFDPVVVDVFVNVWRDGGIESTDSGAGETYEHSLRRLADALSEAYAKRSPNVAGERKML